VTPQRWARVALTLLLVLLAVRAFGDEYADVPLVGSIDTAVHEFGHMLLQPFGFAFAGDTMVILGGSLTQILFPFVFVGYFAFGPRKHRDIHAATVCLWWAAMNMLSVAVYVADARARELTLLSGLTGQEDDGHDWYNLLAQWGRLDRDLIYAARLRFVAAVCVVISTTLGLWAAVQPAAVVTPEHAERS